MKLNHTRTKRNKYFRNGTRRLKGGAEINDEYSIPDLKKLDSVLQEYIKEKRDKAHPGIYPVISSAVTKVKDYVTPYLMDVADKAIDLVSSKTGIDPTNKTQVSEKLQAVINNMNDPIIQEKTKEAIAAAAKNVAVAIKASEPALTQLSKTTADTLSDTASKVGKSGVRVALEILEEIPIAGSALGFVTMIDNITKAGQSLVNANSKIAEASGEAWSEAAENYKENKDKYIKELEEQEKEKMTGGEYRMKEKEINNNMNLSNTILNKVGGSIEEFNNTTMQPYTILNNKTRNARIMRNNKSKHRRNHK